jgi:transposase-like protein
MSLKRRQFTKEFKQQVLREIEAGKSAAQAAREHQVHSNMIYKWQKQQEQHGEQAFPGNGHTIATQEAKIAELERLIGQMTVEAAFLKRVLTTLEARKAANGETR